MLKRLRRSWLRSALLAVVLVIALRTISLTVQTENTAGRVKLEKASAWLQPCGGFFASWISGCSFLGLCGSCFASFPVTALPSVSGKREMMMFPQSRSAPNQNRGRDTLPALAFDSCPFAEFPSGNTLRCSAPNDRLDKIRYLFEEQCDIINSATNRKLTFYRRNKMKKQEISICRKCGWRNGLSALDG